MMEFKFRVLDTGKIAMPIDLEEFDNVVENITAYELNPAVLARIGMRGDEHVVCGRYWRIVGGSAGQVQSVLDWIARWIARDVAGLNKTD